MWRVPPKQPEPNKEGIPLELPLEAPRCEPPKKILKPVDQRISTGSIVESVVEYLNSEVDFSI